MTDSVTSLLVQINTGRFNNQGYPILESVPMLAINNGGSNGGTYALGSVPFVNDLPVTTANPLPVTQSSPPLSYSGPPNATVQTTSNVLVIAGAYTRTFTVTTLPGSTENVWLNPNGAAEIGGWGYVSPGGGSFTFGTDAFPLPAGPLMALTEGGSAQTVLISGG